MPHLVQTLSILCQLTCGMVSKCLEYRLVLRWLAHWAASNTLQINTELSAPLTQSQWTLNLPLSSAHEAGSRELPQDTLPGCLLTHFLLYLRDSSLSVSLFNPSAAVAEATSCLRSVLRGWICLPLGAK